MILKQYYLGCLAHASYLVADETSRVAAVVDPQRDVDQYVADVRELGLDIRYVFLTHFHADFVAGHLELRDRTGAGICLGPRAETQYAFRRFANGDTLELGPQARLEVLETPGHSPESITILVYDLEEDATVSHAALTGDTLFIGDVGRPDLRASLGWTAEELGALLYDSIHDKLLSLADDTLVYPGHGAGSLCGKNLSSETVSTIGLQRQHNYALQPMTKEEFVRVVTADQPDSPAYFSYDAALNAQERPTLERTLREVLKPLTLDELLGLEEEGAQLLDTRDPADFAVAHLVGAVNIGLGGSYATWAGTLLDPARPIAIVADPGREQESATRLGRIGFDRVGGYLDGGMQALDPRPGLVGRTARITASDLAHKTASVEPPVVLDVRTEPEHQAKHVERSLNIPLSHLLERLDKIPRHRALVVHCATDYRATIAASLLARDDFQNPTVLVGGIDAWEVSRGRGHLISGRGNLDETVSSS